jgi:hypothetical protein
VGMRAPWNCTTTWNACALFRPRVSSVGQCGFLRKRHAVVKRNLPPPENLKIREVLDRQFARSTPLLSPDSQRSVKVRSSAGLLKAFFPKERPSDCWGVSISGFDPETPDRSTPRRPARARPKVGYHAANSRALDQFLHSGENDWPSAWTRRSRFGETSPSSLSLG